MNQNVKKSQDRLLAIANIIADIFERHDIPHSIVYGTLLGVVRHKGFIPWDDDFDFCVFEEAYDDAQRCLELELPKDLFLENEKTEPKYFHSWSHVKDLKSEAFSQKYPHDNAYAHNGLSIDLYKMKRVRLGDIPSCVLEQRKIYINRRKELGLIDTKELEIREKRLDQITLAFNRLYPNETEESLQREVYANIYTSLWSMELDDLFPLQKYKFENSDFFGPKNADKILRHWYGDYMQIPPIEMQVSHFDSVIFL